MSERVGRAFLALTPLVVAVPFAVPGPFASLTHTVHVALTLVATVCGLVFDRPVHRPA